jgi:hypothetical protein
VAAERSVSDVLQDILRNLQDILRSEIRLAKAEIREEAIQAASSALWVTAGAVGVLSGWILLLWAIAYALSAVMPMWAATLLTAIATACLGGAFIVAGIRKVSRVTPIPERTIDSIRENLAWMKQSTWPPRARGTEGR